MQTYMIAINFFSEPLFQGSCSHHWFVSKRGNKVTYSGIENAKRYTSMSAAKRMSWTLHEMYPNAMVLVV